MIRRLLAIGSVAALTLGSLASPAGAHDEIGRRLAAMTLPEKVGQMIVSYV